MWRGRGWAGGSVLGRLGGGVSAWRRQRVVLRGCEVGSIEGCGVVVEEGGGFRQGVLL